MTALRTTRSVLARPPRAAALVLLCCGCGGPELPPGGTRPTLVPLPEPTAERIDFDPATGVLSLYDLPDSGRWLVSEPGKEDPVAVGPTHAIRKDADPKYTYIAYNRPTGQRSQWLALSDVMAARTTNPSRQQ